MKKKSTFEDMDDAQRHQEHKPNQGDDMKKKSTFEDMDDAQRVQILKDNAIAVKRHSYLRQFTHAELAEMQGGMIDMMLRREEMQAAFDAVRDEHKEAMKPIDAGIRSTLNGLRDKARSVTEECYVIANMEEGEAEYYNEAGEMVYSRPLEAGERQLPLPNVTRITGTGGK